MYCNLTTQCSITIDSHSIEKYDCPKYEENLVAMIFHLIQINL